MSPGDRPDARALAHALEGCRDAASWTADRALAWWREHPARASRLPSAGPRTIAVALEQRVPT